MLETNANVRNKKEARKEERLSSKLAQALAFADESANVQSTNDKIKKIQLFNNSVEK